MHRLKNILFGNLYWRLRICLFMSFIKITYSISGIGSDTYSSEFKDTICLMGLIILIPTFIYNMWEERKKWKSYQENFKEKEETFDIDGYPEFYEKNPSFDKGSFFLEIREVFVKIQLALQKGDFDGVSKYLSKGMFESFEIELETMKKLDIKVKILNLNILNIKIENMETNKEYDVINIAISYSTAIEYSSDAHCILNCTENKSCIEYWSFIKRNENYQWILSDRARNIDWFLRNPSKIKFIESKIGTDIYEFKNLIANSFFKKLIPEMVKKKKVEAKEWYKSYILDRKGDILNNLKLNHLNFLDFNVDKKEITVEIDYSFRKNKQIETLLESLEFEEYRERKVLFLDKIDMNSKWEIKKIIPVEEFIEYKESTDYEIVDKEGALYEEGMLMVEGGSFEIGSDSGDEDEKPVRKIFLSSFFIGKVPVTKFDYEALINTNYDEKMDIPASGISWMNAIKYCNALSHKKGLAIAYDKSGDLLDKYGDKTKDLTKVEGYRLPTEAEWEFAARGGNESKGYIYSGSNDLGEVAWYYDICKNSKGIQRIGEKKPNELGIYDMTGNVDEWCYDTYSSKSYEKFGEINPFFKKEIGEGEKVVRGGSCYKPYIDYRVTYRCSDDNISSNPRSSRSILEGRGFRIVKSI